MRPTFRKSLEILRASYNRFDPESSTIRLQCLQQLSKMTLPPDGQLILYHDTLLFIQAHPSDPQQIAMAGKELSRITSFLKRSDSRSKKKLTNSGLPFTDTVTRFSHDGLRWLMQHPYARVTLESFDDPLHELNDVLRLTLPALERSETTAGLGNIDLMTVLKVPRHRRLDFIVDELGRFDSVPYVKDHLFDRLDTFVRVTPRHRLFSRTYNRLPESPPYLQRDWIRSVDAESLLQEPLPQPSAPVPSDRKEVIRVIRDAMAVTARETDPSTFMMESSMRLYHLERGVSIAIYDMVPGRQLPLESYVGYTAFKNGLPIAYGGAWIFGHRAQFGINIFEAYRGGESAFILAQLLRTYRQVFDLTYFEIEPYQFGLDNPEGIASGAFWFYYRLGFRPLDPHLRQLAKEEAQKIKAGKDYKTSAATLIRFTESPIGLRLEKKIPPRLADIMLKTTRMIHTQYRDRRLEAEQACRQNFLSMTKGFIVNSADEDSVLTDVAMWASATGIKDRKRLGLMQDMIRVKPKDVYTYQACLRKCLDR